MKARSRTKAYISQLFSPHVQRSITEDFKKSLYFLLLKRIGVVDDLNDTYNEILQDLITKNSKASKLELKKPEIEDFLPAFSDGNYISIITSHPLEVEAEGRSSLYSLREIFFEDFIYFLTNPLIDKNYRFNFPLETSAIIFWRGLRKMLSRYFENSANRSELTERIFLKLGRYGFKGHGADHIELVNSILTTLNEQKKILVFINSAPIYTFPIIALDPATKSSRVYAWLARQDSSASIYELPKDELVLWRLFVWDKIKAKQYAGSPLNYTASLNQ